VEHNLWQRVAVYVNKGVWSSVEHNMDVGVYKPWQECAPSEVYGLSVALGLRHRGMNARYPPATNGKRRYLSWRRSGSIYQVAVG
jgi:hypothetical protein